MNRDNDETPQFELRKELDKGSGEWYKVGRLDMGPGWSACGDEKRFVTHGGLSLHLKGRVGPKGA